MEPTNKLTVIYCRKSQESEDRQALSIPAQIDEGKKLAGQYNIPLKNLMIIEEAKTAKQPGRPKFSDMLAKINAQEIDAILCWKLDRLARNPIDGSAIIWALEQKYIKKIITINQAYFPEDNHIMMHLEFGMASQYSRDLSSNVKRGTKKKFEDGWWTGSAPIGYLNNTNRNEPPIIKDPERFSLVRKMWDMMLTGNYTVPQIMDIANEEWGLRTPTRGKNGGKKLSRSGSYFIFNNSFYYGFMERGNLRGWGKHPPMVTEEEFQIVQTRLGRNGHTRPQTKMFAYRGLIKCGECGCTVTPEHKKNKSGRIYTYYRCSRKKNSNTYQCGQKHIRSESLEKEMMKAIASFKIPESFKDWIIKYLNVLNETETKNRNQVYRKSTQGLRIQAKRIGGAY